MTENPNKKLKNFQLRAKVPLIVRGLAIFAVAATLIAVGIAFYNANGRRDFRMTGLPELSKDVTAEVSNYERRETDGDVPKYYIKAGYAKTFADNHQELENVYLQVFDETGEKSDQITSEKAIYVPAENKNFKAYFAGNVNIETRDLLKVKTDQLSYDKSTEIANAEEAIEFAKDNVAGKSFGAIVNVQAKTLELLKDVEINAYGGGEGELANADFQRARIKSGYAFVNQQTGKIELKNNVEVNVTPKNAGETAQPTDIKSDRATASFVEKELRKIELNGNVDVYQKPTNANKKWTKAKAKRAVADIDKEVKKLELFDDVNIETANNNAAPTNIKTAYALYLKDADRFELKNGVEIVTATDNQQTVIHSNDAVYEQANGKIFLYGNAEITKGTDYLKGDNLTAELYPAKSLKNVWAKGNAFMRQSAPEQTTEVSADQFHAVFGDKQNLQTAQATGAANAVLIPAKPAEYTKVTLSAPNAVNLQFRGDGLLSEMQTDGRTTITMNAPTGKVDAANKKLIADAVKTSMNADGKNLAKAEAVGNAELYIEPLRAAPENYRTTINAARFDCEFFPVGNDPKNCAGTGRTKTVRVPTAPTENRGTQTLLADNLNTAFNQKTADIERFDASGNTKFSELDRNGIANQIVYTANDETVRLRGGEPTVWDSKARAKAGEIDWDLRNDKSFLRGKVSTTYYSQKQTGGATPFSQSNAPVYVTADAAEFQHKTEIGIYTGNARAWQENNYLRADRLTLRQKQGQLYGEGAVQSVLYDAKRKENGKETNVPVSAASQKIYYSKDKNMLRYETDVDIRQGTDRITSNSANIFLNDKNELTQTIAETNVVVTSPNRKATGDYAQYTASDESVILRGNPAQVDDAESGSTQGAQVTVFLRDKRVQTEGKTNQNNSGRIRSVYKVKNN